jgi:site-specific recombinase XerD
MPHHSAGSGDTVMGVGQKMITMLLGHAESGATEWYTRVQVEQTIAFVEARRVMLYGRRPARRPDDFR